MKTIFCILAVTYAVLFVSACSVVPAKLKRHHVLEQDVACSCANKSLHELTEDALKTPNRGESAHALGHLIEQWIVDRDGADAGVIMGDSIGSRTYRLKFGNEGPGQFAANYFDKVYPAVDFKVERLEHFSRTGYGTPLLAIRENRQRESIEKYYPPEVISREVTAILHVGKIRDGIQDLHIDLLCTLYHENARANGNSYKLAADYSIAYGGLLERSQQLKKSEIGDLLTRTPKQKPHLYLMEPYDPRKEPLIMIHGLLDSSLVWAQLTNKLRSDPAVRKRFQIWHFRYNTSAPALYSGRILRQQYRELKTLLDPTGKHPASRSTTIIAHSMGGIVARGLITDTGNAFWQAAFNKPIDELNLSKQDRTALMDAFFWKPDPSIHRVVFLAVPHRGSYYADNWIGRLGKKLFSPPTEFSEFYRRINKDNPGAFTEEFRSLREGRLDSVGALSPEQPTLQILPNLPIGKRISLHSIIGDRGKGEPVEQSSDGIVAYWSSHLDNTDSEVIVPTGHGIVNHPDSINEILRILSLP